MDNNNNNNKQPDINAIPDLTLMTSKILEFIDFIAIPSTKELKKNNIGGYNYIVDERFSILPISMIKLLSEEENIATNLEKIMDMIRLLQDVKNGKNTFEITENEFFEKRAEEYVYPQFGGKEQFYKTAEENKLKQEKKNKKK